MTDVHRALAHGLRRGLLHLEGLLKEGAYTWIEKAALEEAVRVAVIQSLQGKENGPAEADWPVDYAPLFRVAVSLDYHPIPRTLSGRITLAEHMLQLDQFPLDSCQISWEDYLTRPEIACKRRQPH